jgi:hypothetical protein
MGGGVGIIYRLPAACLMTSADRNDLMPAQEKLEWVTPKISLMEAGDTEMGKPNAQNEVTSFGVGPS